MIIIVEINDMNMHMKDHLKMRIALGHEHSTFLKQRKLTLYLPRKRSRSVRLLVVQNRQMLDVAKRKLRK